MNRLGIIEDPKLGEDGALKASTIVAPEKGVRRFESNENYLRKPGAIQ